MTDEDERAGVTTTPELLAELLPGHPGQRRLHQDRLHLAPGDVGDHRSRVVHDDDVVTSLGKNESQHLGSEEIRVHHDHGRPRGRSAGTQHPVVPLPGVQLGDPPPGLQVGSMDEPPDRVKVM